MKYMFKIEFYIEHRIGSQKVIYLHGMLHTLSLSKFPMGNKILLNANGVIFFLAVSFIQV